MLLLQHLYSVHLSSEKVDCTAHMADQTRVLLAACDCLNVDLSRVKLVLLVSISLIISLFFYLDLSIGFLRLFESLSHVSPTSVQPLSELPLHFFFTLIPLPIFPLPPLLFLPTQPLKLPPHFSPSFPLTNVSLCPCLSHQGQI